MHRRIFFLFSLCVVFWMSGGLCAVPPATVEDLARGIRQNRERLHSVEFDFQCDRYSIDAADSNNLAGTCITLPASPNRRNSGHFQADPQRAELLNRTEYFANGKAVPGGRLVQAWDGHYFWHEFLPPSTELQCPNLSIS